MALQQLTADVLAEATGRRQRLDAIAPGGGGPAGNARLTAAIGLVLLVLFLAELVTLLDVTGLIGWHVAIGVLLVPPALLKTASTGWRIVRYYGGDRDYRASGPPPMLLRLLGPLVVLSTLGLLGSGLALIALGPEASRYALIQALGQRVDAVTVHQAFFACWAVATGLHVLARLVPAVALAVQRSAVPGGRRRLAAIALTVIVAAITAALLLGTAAAWAHAGHPSALRPAPGALDRAGHTMPGACAPGAVAGQLDTRHPATRRVLRPGCAAPERADFWAVGPYDRASQRDSMERWSAEVSAVTHAMPGQRTITVGQLRALLETLPADTPLLVGIRDRHRFNSLLGDLAVTGAAIMRSGSGRALTFDVEKLT